MSALTQSPLLLECNLPAARDVIVVTFRALPLLATGHQRQQQRWPGRATPYRLGLRGLCQQRHSEGPGPVAAAVPGNAQPPQLRP